MHAVAVLRGCIAAWITGAAALALVGVVHALWRGDYGVLLHPYLMIEVLLIFGILPALPMTVVALLGAGLAALLRADVSPPMAMSVAFLAVAWFGYATGAGWAGSFGSAGFVASCAGAGWLAAFGRRWWVPSGRTMDR